MPQNSPCDRPMGSTADACIAPTSVAGPAACATACWGGTQTRAALSAPCRESTLGVPDRCTSTGSFPTAGDEGLREFDRLPQHARPRPKHAPPLLRHAPPAPSATSLDGRGDGPAWLGPESARLLWDSMCKGTRQRAKVRYVPNQVVCRCFGGTTISEGDPCVAVLQPVYLARHQGGLLQILGILHFRGVRTFVVLRDHRTSKDARPWPFDNRALTTAVLSSTCIHCGRGAGGERGVGVWVFVVWGPAV